MSHLNVIGWKIEFVGKHRGLKSFLGIITYPAGNFFKKYFLVFSRGKIILSSFQTTYKQAK